MRSQVPMDTMRSVGRMHATRSMVGLWVDSMPSGVHLLEQVLVSTNDNPFQCDGTLRVSAVVQQGLCGPMGAVSARVQGGGVGVWLVW
eukprot:CAMPEP_0194552906 /NCGR_PEP_ID=MMETSP0253-20130528/96965_1 /TAXON_ID=2966 /ORGANISM="Noctiluca scintillans" /LENGTH=87 /DNA_ID=CAMNT_0039400381 /DNA_START=254 /DNA_END=514 /DNA_ORIENTATION=+